jgi:hypothetical protein
MVYIEIQPIVANFSTPNDLFALAQKMALAHIEPAFQASSPKTSMARPATVGPFFLSRSIAPFAIGAGRS